MSKGSGRRRITPSDGLQYNPDTDMTNIEERGGAYHQTAKRELALGLRTGAQPTAHKDYGSHSGTGTNGRYGGVGRKNDFRNWKSYTRGKQYDHKEDRRQQVADHRPVTEAVKKSMREKSLNALIHEGRKFRSWNGELYSRDDYVGFRYQSPSLWKREDPPLMKLGFLKFSERATQIERWSAW